MDRAPLWAWCLAGGASLAVLALFGRLLLGLGAVLYPGMRL